jgi:hypothetical protein
VNTPSPLASSKGDESIWVGFFTEMESSGRVIWACNDDDDDDDDDYDDDDDDCCREAFLVNQLAIAPVVCPQWVAEEWR